MTIQGGRFGVTRRTALRTGGAGLLVASIAGCDLFSTQPSGQKRSARSGGSQSAGDAKESPALAALVKQGDLPPLEERLPEQPMIVKPTERTGSYGGTWHTALLGAADTAWLRRTIGYEDLTRWNHPWTGTIPNVAQHVEAAPNKREFTITLRKGMKWSDGKPFTADDLVFAWNDVLRNSELTPVMPLWMLSEDEPADLEKVDDKTVRLVFVKPSSLFTTYLAYACTTLVQNPRHYLEQFHKKHNPQVAQDAKDANFDSWADYFMAKADIWANKDLPRFHAWKLTTELGVGNRVVAERNPYYFKTDPDGRQLPYLDKVVYEVISDDQVILLKASNGELDFHTRHINTPPNKPVLARSRDKGGFHFINLKPAFDNEMVIALNLAHKDPVKREIFQNKDFRIGLSHAINRTELIKTVYQAQGAPWQAAPREESTYYDEEFAKQYTEYDVDKANQHLDRAGYDQRDGQGFRLGPDGKRIFFAVEVAHPAVIPFWVDGMDLVIQYWKKVGIDARVKSEDRSLFYERKEANQHDAGVWTDAGGLTKDIVLDPRWDMPYSSESIFATPWAAWFSSHGETGDKPPAPARRQMDLYRQFLVTADETEAQDLFRQVLKIAKEQFYVIGTVKAISYYGIVKNELHNVPNDIWESHIYDTPAPCNPEQLYFSDQ